MLQAPQIIDNFTRSSHPDNCFHLSYLYTRGVPLALLSLAGILLLKAMVLSHPKDRRKHLKYSCGTLLLALLCLSHQWFWIFPGLALYKLLPALARITNISHPSRTLPDSHQDVSDEQYDTSQDRKPAEEGSTSLHYQYLSSYYSYDEQPLAHYPQALPPHTYSSWH
ncbi:hypothetical protein [Dictyobacter aurantiacus]|uniref:Uncharacterized protein n=1 Tax=Dictyobacter aurantiacus TaxID=1936993 RepID=A0A401ZS03_9CHLR|nr:hypothetical protein [Dictyobacter aurantiacus]GCE09645.1 hypothetical protein KDAU_69740 [Dictyobacter aurantiacus]